MMRGLPVSLGLVLMILPRGWAQQARSSPAVSRGSPTGGFRVPASLGGMNFEMRRGLPFNGGLASALPGSAAPRIGAASARELARGFPDPGTPGGGNPAEFSPAPDFSPAAPGSRRLLEQTEPAGSRVSALSSEFSDLSRQAPGSSQAPGEGDHSFGRATGDLLAGVRSAPAAAVLGSDERIQWGKPAGESISRAAEAEYGGVERAPVPAPASIISEAPSGRREDTPAPVVGAAAAPRLAASLISAAPLAPAWQFFTAGPAWVGALMAVTSLALAAAPWLPKRTPRWLRDVPAMLVSIMGAAAFATGVSLIIGPLAVLGGWGLSRLSGKSAAFPQWYSPGSRPVLSAAVAAAAAVAATGLALGGVFGALPWAITAAAGLLSVFLLIHLPLPILESAGGLAAKLFLGAAMLAGLGRLALWVVLAPLRRLRRG